MPNPYVTHLTGLGFAVFPLAVNGKVPVQRGWQMAATTNPAIAEMYFGVQPFNYGVLTGAPSAGLVVIDCDTAEAAEGIADTIVPTYTVKTPRGVHYYYRTPKRCKTMTNMFPQVDIRGEGGLVVAPGSHINGVHYVTLHDLPVATLPEALADKIPEPSVSMGAAGIKPVLPFLGENPMFQPVIALIYTSARMLKDGERNSELFKLACQLSEFVASGVVNPNRLDQLAEISTECGLSLPEARRTIGSAYRKVTGRSL